jgi:hypothetical protein
MNTSNARKPLPNDLRAAYAWTAAAGELGQLSELRGDDLEAYVLDSAENAREHGDDEVLSSDLRELADWLRSGREVSR